MDSSYSAGIDAKHMGRGLLASKLCSDFATVEAVYTLRGYPRDTHHWGVHRRGRLSEAPINLDNFTDQPEWWVGPTPVSRRFLRCPVSSRGCVPWA